MTDIPQVSVVMSVYNGAGTLRETMESVLTQTGIRLELIVVNDGSTDETPEILNEIARSDARVRIFTQENAGITAGLIRGCANARGRYIARQDAGDWSLDRRLERQYAALEADSELSFVSCWTEECGPCKEFLSVAKGTGRAVSPKFIISEKEVNGVIDGPSSHPSVMIRRDRYEAVGGYRPQFYFGQDWDLWYRLGESGKFQMVEHVLYRSRVTPGSLSGKYGDAQNAIGELSHQALLRRRRGEGEDDLLSRVADIRPGPNSSISTRSTGNGFYFIGERLRRNGDDRAEAYLRKAISVAPSNIRSWVRLAQLTASKLLRRPRPAKTP